MPELPRAILGTSEVETPFVLQSRVIAEARLVQVRAVRQLGFSQLQVDLMLTVNATPDRLPVVLHDIRGRRSTPRCPRPRCSSSVVRPSG
jgi:hypothetical protein